MSVATGSISGLVASTGIGLAGQIAWNTGLGVIGGIADTAIDANETTTFIDYVKSGVWSGILGALAGKLGGAGSATKHLQNSFMRVLKNRNWSYYFTQIGKEALRSGISAIKACLKGTVPALGNALLDKYY